MRIYDHDALCRTYFLPERDAPPPAAGTGAPVRIPHPDGFALSAWWSRPSPGAPTVLLSHGSGESVRTDIAFWPRFFAHLGVNLLRVDYPGYGASEGHPTFSSCAAAGRAALRFLLAEWAGERPHALALFEDGDPNSVLAENGGAHERLLQEFLSNLEVPGRDTLPASGD